MNRDNVLMWTTNYTMIVIWVSTKFYILICPFPVMTILKDQEIHFFLTENIQLVSLAERDG